MMRMDREPPTEIPMIRDENSFGSGASVGAIGENVGDVVGENVGKVGRLVGFDVGALVGLVPGGHVVTSRSLSGQTISGLS